MAKKPTSKPLFTPLDLENKYAKRLEKLTKWMNKDLKSRLKLTGNWETTLSELQAEYSKMFEKAAPAIFMPMLTGVDNATSRLLGLQPRVS